jgi:hypothetical protein
MSFFTNDINESYITKIYEDLQKEQMNLMNELKTNTNEECRNREKDITRQISLINSINLGLMRLRNVRKKSNGI